MEGKMLQLKFKKLGLSLFVLCFLCIIGCNTTTPISLDKNSEKNKVADASGQLWWPSSGSYQIPGGYTTDKGFTGAYFNNRFYIFYKGPNSYIYVRSAPYVPNLNDLSWTTPSSIGVQSVMEPSAIVFNNYLYVFWKGYTGNYIYFKRMSTSGTWSNFVRLPTTYSTPHAVGLTVSDNSYWGGEKLLHIVFKGVTSSYIYYGIMDANHVWLAAPYKLDQGGPGILQTNSRPSATFINSDAGCLIIAYVNLTNQPRVAYFSSYENIFIHHLLAPDGDYVLGTGTSAYNGPGIVYDDVLERTYWAGQINNSNGQIGRFHSHIYSDWDNVNMEAPDWTLTQACVSMFLVPDDYRMQWILHKGASDNYMYARVAFYP
jgi:hypothetical protein